MSGKDLQIARLVSGDVSVEILSLGCITHDWRVPVGDTRLPVVLSYRDPADHLNYPGTFKGVLAGRVANRISGARFSLDGQTYTLAANDGENQLHGGPQGIGRRLWGMEKDGARAVQLCLHSPDGDQGFPGAVEFTTVIRLDGHRLTYEMSAVVDRPTPINLAQHNYYNLMGTGKIWNHSLQVQADRFTPVDDQQIPTGDILSLEETRYDFRTPKGLRAADPSRLGIDINYVLSGRQSPAAVLEAPNGLRLRLWTDQPGLQLYTGQHLVADGQAIAGQDHGPFGGICLEPQHFPDSPNNPQFPSIVCTPEVPYHQVLSIEIA